MSIEVTIPSRHESRRPAGTLQAEVEWSTTEPPEEVEVRLLWRTSGRGDEEEGVAAVRRIQHPGSGSTQRIEFDLPAAPWSFDGQLVKIAWFMDATLWPSGEHTQAEFVLSPTGSPLVPLLDATEDLLAQIPEGRTRTLVARLLERVAKSKRDPGQPSG